MKGSKRGNLLLAVLLGLTGAFLIISYYKVMAGPLRSVLESKATWIMFGEVALVFAWNLFWLRKAYGGNGKAGGKTGGNGNPVDKISRAGNAGNPRTCWLCVAGGAAVFTWCHQILVPIAVSGLYVAVLILWGRWIHRLFAWKIRQSSVEELSMSLVTGSAFWMVIVCLISLTGHGGIKFWRVLALVLGGAAIGAEAYLAVRRGRIGQKMPGMPETSGMPGMPGTPGVPGTPGMPEVPGTPETPGCLRRQSGKTYPWLLAFIITMVLIQAGRLNIELDYDSLHYGLRSAFVLDNGKGIYENLGMINLVYTYSKGLEVLALPLSGTPTYGFVLAFSLWMTIAVLVLAVSMVRRKRGLGMGLFAAAVLSSIPGIMNMAATAKSDIITLLHQLIIYDFLCRAFEKKERTPWLLMAVATYLLTLVYKPTALVFSTALGGTALICLMATGRFSLGDKKGWLLLLLPAGAAAGLWYRTWLMTGVPVTSIFAGFCERLGWKVRYPFSFSHVIGDPSMLTAGEKLARLGRRLGEMLTAPVSMDMDHVVIAWGTGLVTLFLFIWSVSAIRGRKARTPLEVFDRVLMAVMTLGCIASIYTLSQVDGNYFILFYSLLVIISMRMEGSLLGRGTAPDGMHGLGRGIGMAVICFMIVNVPLTCLTSWAGQPGFTPVRLKHMGYYDHRREARQRDLEIGCMNLVSGFSPRTRVLAFGNHPDVLDISCSVQSYYDVTGSGGNVYLVKRLKYFEEFLEYAGTEYFFVEKGYLAAQPRALEMIEDMIEEGSLTDLKYEWGNLSARVTLPPVLPADPEAAVGDFRNNYSFSSD